MAGVTSINVKESLDDLVEQLRHADTQIARERLQVLYWLKQENAPSISTIAKAVGKHRNTLQTWLSSRWGLGSDVGGQKIAWGSASNSAMGRSCFGKAVKGEQQRIP